LPIVVAALAAGSFALSALCVAGLRRWAAERMLDIPNVRSSHTRPTPRGGGLGIVVSVLAGIWGLFFFRILSVPFAEIGALSLGAGLVALAGWIDDSRGLSYRQRLVVQVIGAAIVMVAIGHYQTVAVPLFGEIDLALLGVPLTFFWITGLTNAYNFMDGIDGIAGGQAVAAGLGWMLLGLTGDQPFAALPGILLAAAGLGFLVHNWPPARIFMGDVGSAFIGFVLAVLPVIAARKDPLFLIAGFLVVWPFVFDTAFTLVRRLMRRENVFEAHRSHIYQRLVISGYGHRSVSLLYIGLALAGDFMAFLWYKGAPLMGAVVVAAPVLLFAGLWLFTVRAESRARKGERR